MSMLVLVIRLIDKLMEMTITQFWTNGLYKKTLFTGNCNISIQKMFKSSLKLAFVQYKLYIEVSI